MTPRTIRCAIYTRKSSEEGLDQTFNSLDAQREAGRDYIKSQKHQGWSAIATAYDDGGYSGGSIDRPGLQRLLADIRLGRVDVVVVYKVDRLSRSLADFARLMQLFDEHEVSFVSVTQQFNTTTSMGRLTLNMLLSFAQFEREVAGERIRDKIAATKRRGVWVCGQPPLGYRLPREDDPGYTPGDRALRVIPPEAELVRAIFEGYLELGSPVELARRLNARGHTTKRWTSSRGREHGGRPLTTAFLNGILTNPVYIGKIAGRRSRSGENGELHDGTHEPIVDRALWDRVHERMGGVARAPRMRSASTHLLVGKLRTSEGHAMSPSTVQRPASKRAGSAAARRVVRYYVSQKALKHGFRSCPIRSINAGHLDDLVRGLVLDHLAHQHHVDLTRLDATQREECIKGTIHRVVIAPASLTIELDREQIAASVRLARQAPSTTRSRAGAVRDAEARDCPFAPEVDDHGAHASLSLTIQIKQHDGRRMILGPDGQELLGRCGVSTPRTASPHIARAIGQAYAWRDELLRTGKTIESLATTLGITAGRVHAMLSLTRLGPSVLRAALTGNLPPSTSLADLLRAAKDLDWEVQQRALGLKA
ncbi:MAG: recombinase family protein [Phycisphaerales bacterium]|jgi:DNA invertase Pin-like site-specific DNA recombinase|nr:recombinase family protein [Phycisphaerales bacterium]